MGMNDELKEWMQQRFDRIMARFDRIDRYLEKMAIKEKLLEGEKLLDNQDVCQMLNVSKRTLQRYRSSGELPYQMVGNVSNRQNYFVTLRKTGRNDTHDRNTMSALP
jgi:hypothetical protein